MLPADARLGFSGALLEYEMGNPIEAAAHRDRLLKALEGATPGPNDEIYTVGDADPSHCPHHRSHR